MFPNRRGIQKRHVVLNERKKLALSFFHAESFFSYFFLTGVFFPQVLLTVVEYFMFPHFLMTNKMSEVPFNVASNISHR